MFEFQSHLIFPTHAVPPAGPWPPGAERLSLETPDGKELAGIHIPADDRSADARPDPRLRRQRAGTRRTSPNISTSCSPTRRSSPSTTAAMRHRQGSPSAEALIADAPLVYDLAVEQVKPKRVVAIGFSIGSGIAAQLAAARKLDGLILVTPFDSLKAVAQSMYPWLPIGPFFEHEIDAASALENAQGAGRDHRRGTRRDRPVRANRRAEAPNSRTWSSTAPSRAPDTTTSTPDPTSTTRSARLSSVSNCDRVPLARGAGVHPYC